MWDEADAILSQHLSDRNEENQVKLMLKFQTNTSKIRVRERNISTERPPLVGEVSANVCGSRVPRGQSEGSLLPYFLLSRPEERSNKIVSFLISGYILLPWPSFQMVCSFSKSNTATYVGLIIEILCMVYKWKNVRSIFYDSIYFSLSSSVNNKFSAWNAEQFVFKSIPLRPVHLRTLC
jgi:hypothetical protein